MTATDAHPFWSASAHGWVNAAELRPGDLLQTAGGETVRVVAARPYTETLVVYNLSVEGIHTYFVLAGDAAVLVHNDSRTLRCNLGGGQWWQDAAHIVAQAAKRAARARRVLARFNIDIDEAINGVLLPPSRDLARQFGSSGIPHQNSHTRRFYAEVNRRLRHVGSAEEARAVLSRIGEEMEAGIFPF